MRNLEAALALVDRVHPDQSPLLTVPRKTHGGTSGPIFGPRQEQAFKHLVDWVALVVPPRDGAECVRCAGEFGRRESRCAVGPFSGENGRRID